MSEIVSTRGVPRKLSPAAVLFDLDGTLADTVGDLVAALNRVRADQGLAPISIDTLRAHASSGARGMLGAGLGLGPNDDRYAGMRDAFLDYYEQGLANTTALFDGIEPLLTTLEARAIRWGIVTNKAERFTFPLLAALGLDRRASVIVCGDTTAHPKPHPAPLLHAAAQLGTAVAACVYVGDDLRDVQAGNAAGMPTIVAKYGYLGDSGDCTGWPATGWIESPDELLAWIA
jgi:N-acetyl-D-muramate 6-phosphate phosphatase